MNSHRRQRRSTKHFERGLEWFHSGQFAKAVAELSKAVDLEPTPDNLLVRGMAYARSEHFSEAISDLERVLEFSAPSRIIRDAYYNLGLAHERLSDTKKAVEWYGRAIEQEPGFADAYCNRGAQLLKLGRHKEAIVDLDKAVDLNPEDFLAYWHRAQAYGQLGNVEQHWSDLEACLRCAPDEHPLHRRIGALFA